MASKLEQLSDALADHLAEIETYFKVPVKVTLVIRQPGNDEGDVVIGSDTAEGAIAAIRRREAGPSRVFGGPPCPRGGMCVHEVKCPGVL